MDAHTWMHIHTHTTNATIHLHINQSSSLHRQGMFSTHKTNKRKSWTQKQTGMKSLMRVFWSCCAVGNPMTTKGATHPTTTCRKAAMIKSTWIHHAVSTCRVWPSSSAEQPNTDEHTHWSHLTGAKAFRDTFRRDSKFRPFSSDSLGFFWLQILRIL